MFQASCQWRDNIDFAMSMYVDKYSSIHLSVCLPVSVFLITCINVQPLWLPACLLAFKLLVYVYPFEHLLVILVVCAFTLFRSVPKIIIIHTGNYI